MRSLLKVLVFLVLVLGAAWGALWWYAEGRMQAGVSNWIAATEASGTTQVTYDALTRGASPLAATVTLANPRLTYQPQGVGEPITVSAPSLTLRIDATDPLVLHADLASQINVATPRGALALTYANLTDAVQLDPHALFDPRLVPLRGPFSVTADHIALLAAMGGVQVLTVDSFTEQGDVNLQAGPGEDAYDVTLNLTNIALSPLLARLGNVPFGGRVDAVSLSEQVSGPLPEDWPQSYGALQTLPPGPAKRQAMVKLLQNWAAAGGTAKADFGLTLGSTVFKASGNVAFDANVQPGGTAEVSATHLDAFIAAVSAAYPQGAAALNQAQARLTPYLSTNATDGQVLDVHLAYGAGGVTANGQRVADMPKLNWDTLANPPPPPAQAPGDGSGAAVP